jgi:hypothetical protein
MNVVEGRLVSYLIKKGMPPTTAQSLVRQAVDTALNATTPQAGDDVRDSIAVSIAAVTSELKRLESPQTVN